MISRTFHHAGWLLVGAGIFFSPDQLGQRLINRGDYRQAATTFRDPAWQGIAWYRAGEFEKAEMAFARTGGAAAELNRGNALVMLGKYDLAVQRYDRALELHPDWKDAQINREIAATRAERVRQQGGDMGDQKVGADEIRFDRKGENKRGQETEVSSEKVNSDAAMQAMWLRRVQTQPADFLKAKFAFQLAGSDDAQEDQP